MKTWMTILFSLALLGTAAAEDETPWGKGVPTAKRTAAEQLLEQGNQLFLTNKFSEALAMYEKALASWDHPAIRFNVVRCLIALERPLEAWNNLQRALAFGNQPFEDQLYNEALNYKRLLDGQIAELTVSCKQPEVRIKVDGEKWLDCPGTKTKQAMPGNHVIVGERAGFMTKTVDAILLPGKPTSHAIQLETYDEAVVYKSRWKTWQPWVVVGAGVVLAGVGLWVDQGARSDLDELERAAVAFCSADGCSREEYAALSYKSRESSALTQNKIGLGLLITGGAVAIAGTVGVILNRPRPVARETNSGATARLVPTLTPEHAGVAIVGGF